MTRAVFAIPGDKDRKTGGFLYEATVLRVLNEIGVETKHLQLPDSFPDPTEADMAATISALKAVPPHTPIILDGLVFGSIDPVGLAQVKAPVIAMIHHPLGLETGLEPARAAFLRSNEAEALKVATHTIVPSSHTARILARDFGVNPDSITVACPGFDRPSVFGEPVDPPIILSVGLLAPRKGHDVLLDALSQIRDLRWNAVIVGKAHDSSYAKSLRKQCNDLGLSQRVAFMGELGIDALVKNFNAASIFALATRYEGYGMVLSEAMFYGLPVVSCSVGAVPQTVGDAGILTPPDDPAAFSAALKQLLTDPEQVVHFRQMSQARAQSLPSWLDTAELVKSVINQIATQNERK